MANPLFKAVVNITKSVDKQGQVFKAVDAIKDFEVLVGIPQENSGRTGEITNAELAYIHTQGVHNTETRQVIKENMDSGATYGEAHQMMIHSLGSPMFSIPPRPIIEPAIEQKETKEAIADQFKQASESALEGNQVAAEQHLEKAGMIGQNASRAWFTNSKNGWAANAPSTIKAKGSDKPLIDTGELRKAITYKVRKK